MNRERVRRWRAKHPRSARLQSEKASKKRRRRVAREKVGVEVEFVV